MAGEADSGVTVVRSAFGDLRFDRLAQICDLADGDHARGKMARLWNQCLEEETTILTRDDVETVLGDRAVEGLTRARLGRELEDGRIYMHGTSTGKRVTWLGEARQQASAAGQASAKGRARDEKGRLLPRSVTNEPSATSSENPAAGDFAGPAESSDGPAVASPLTPSSSPSSGDLSHPHPRAIPEAALGVSEQYAIQCLNEARDRVRPGCEHIHPMAGSRHPRESSVSHGEQLRHHLSRYATVDERNDKIRKAVAKLEAEVRGGAPLERLSLGYLAGPKAWDRNLAGDPTDANRSGAGPPGPPGRSPRPDRPANYRTLPDRSPKP